MKEHILKIPTPGRVWLRIKNRATKRRILFRTVLSFLDNDLITSSAAITYFGMLVLFPALLLAVSIAQSYFGETIHRELMSRIPNFMPGSAPFVQRNLEAISNVSASLLVTAFTVMLWAGSWIFTVIERAMCKMWGTQPRSFLHGRLLTVGMIGAVGLVLLASLLVTSGIVTAQTLIGKWEIDPVPKQLIWLGSMLWQVVFAVVSLLITMALFLLIYRVMPNTRLTFIEVLPGAIVAGILWEIAKYAFAWSIPYFHYDLLYGSIGAGVALLTWGYLSSLIMLFGAQLTAVLHCRRMFGEDMEDDNA
jgi:YihY family inner membrane protein